MCGRILIANRTICPTRDNGTVTNDNRPYWYITNKRGIPRERKCFVQEGFVLYQCRTTLGDNSRFCREH